MNKWWRKRQAQLLERIESYSLESQARFQRMMRLANEKQMMRLGYKRAQVAAWHAWEMVPAYRDFLNKNNIDGGMAPFEELPITSKDGYIKAYPTEQRCLNGSFMARGVAIDESSGSTGVPYNWVRSEVERKRVHQVLLRSLEWLHGSKPKIAINAFSMGAWATGVNTGETLALHSVVKSTGPDLEKILHTLEFFGSKNAYLICAYPPFLKLIMDTAAERGIDLDKYELHAVVGGEGMSEELRRYLATNFKTCFSGYGASDLEMGIAAESPESILIRGMLNDNVELCEALLDGDHRVPMVFQYNPLSYYIETNDRDELIVTMNYSKILSPRIRYNIGDEAKLFTREYLLTRLSELGHPVDIDPMQTIPLPYLLLFGRRDQTISVMGANIYPEDIERLIYAHEKLAGGFSSFMISVKERDDGLTYPSISIEWCTPEPPEISTHELQEVFTRGLTELNADFKNASEEYPDALKLAVEIHGFGTGPFAERGRRIKNRYLVKG